jgi:hypothetical protein
MRIDRWALGGALAAIVLVAGCGSSPTPAPTVAPNGGASSAPASAAPAASAAAAASEQPAATDNGSTGNGGLLPGSAPELEAMLPSSVNGVAFERTSFGGAAWPAGIPIGQSDLETFLQQNGKSLSDVSIAMATPTDTSKAGTFLMAFQVKGVDGTKLADVLGGTSGSDLTTSTVGGKQVLQAGLPGMGIVLYVKNDVVFYVLALGDASLTDSIVAALP